MKSHAEHKARGQRQMAWWLYGCCGMVFGMVALGGVTRLTGSGLSMVDWKPSGILPPMNRAGWEAEFDKYKSYPEYQKHNDELTLEEFKWIWYMEWGHRMAGRWTGIVFTGPLIFFGMRGMIERKLAPRLLGLLLLGGSQGLIGWWMVKSGLDDSQRWGNEGRVSPYRLATHLTMAFVLYTGLFNTALGLHTTSKLALLSPAARAEMQSTLSRIPASFRRVALGVAHLVGLTAFSGAFVAGNHAGMVYDEFPTMGGKLIPDDLVNPFLEPAWRNFFEHDTMVQWNHRVLAMTTFASICGLHISSRYLRIPLPRPALIASNALLGMSFIQVGLGISTLLLHVPVPIASAHQMGSLTLLTLSMWFVHTLRPIAMPALVRGRAPLAAVALALAATEMHHTEEEDESILELD